MFRTLARLIVDPTLTNPASVPNATTADAALCVNLR
jgi:hypothetical protein